MLVNRAPFFHKYSIMAFKPVIIGGDAPKLSPLVTAGFNTDFDGDTMGVHVLVTEEARIEALGMLPSQNLFKPGTTNKLMFNLRLEYVAPIFNLTQPPQSDAKPTRIFKDYQSLHNARLNRLGVQNPTKLCG